MGIFRRIWALGNRPRLGRENQDELREHMQMRIDANVAKGMSLEAAAREARLRFGNPTVFKERVEAEDAALGVDSLMRDARYALRGFFRNPGFTLVAILTLALGIGANTAVFQLVDAVRLRSLPIAAPNELAELRVVGGNQGFGVTTGPFATFTVPMWLEVRRNHEPFSGIFAWRQTGMMVGKLGDAKQVDAIEVSGDFFNVLGVAPWQGRLIEPQDESSCQVSKVVVSYSFWKSHMGGRPITSDTTIVAEDRAVQVLGVVPPSFFGLSVGDRFDVAFPTCTPPNPRREAFVFTVMGRLKPGWTMDRASAYFNALSGGLFQSVAPTDYDADKLKVFTSFRLRAYPAGAGVSMLREIYDTSLQLLLAITGLVLLIACANLANLMLARASTRQREMAIRIALGASRARLLRQMLMESSLLALTGAALGVAIAQPLSRLLVSSLNTSRAAIQLTITPDWRVLLFAAGVAVLTAILFGTVPALRGAKADPNTALKSGSRGTTGSRERFSVQRFMVITQVAVSMVLLVGALLFVRSYRNLVTTNPGMRETGMTTGHFGFFRLGIKSENDAEFKRQLVELVRSVPGVENAGSTTFTPLGNGSWEHNIRVGTIDGATKFTYASPSYFATMGIPLLTGRNFTDADTNSTPFVLVVNQAFIRKYLGSAQPVGQPVHVLQEPHYPERMYRIIGTIPDTKYNNNLRDDAVPMAFAPASQLPITAQGPGVTIMIASNNSAATVADVRRAVLGKYPSMGMDFFDFQQEIRDNLVGDRMMAMLSGFFGVLAAILVVVGLYGVLSFIVAKRSNEIGIRIALGARRWQVIRLIMRDTASMLITGVFFGTILALLAGRTASSLLFGLKPYDAVTIASAFILLAVSAVFASWVPAIRASRLNPTIALRTE
jgi:predicted permease